ncbi:MAG: hypothetical protein HY706_19880 [Candidatus Hydrogenedentes bacterium]|nr:hypothetical protein [Candidatus Hydrogenedentota bacterium]
MRLLHWRVPFDTNCGDAGVPPGQAVVYGMATVDGHPGHVFTVSVEDHGEPGNGVDRFEIALDAGYHAGGYLTAGNIQVIHDPEQVEEQPSLDIQTLWELRFGADGLGFRLGLL